mgnify:CR=1 FL=1|jgi:hypothetical protein
MSFITGTHLPRRTFLRGVGAAVALPLLDSMIPAGRLGARVKQVLDRPRLITIENCHGAAGSNAWGASQYLWAPEAVGKNYDLTSSALAPLESYRDILTIVSNTDVRMAEAFTPKEIGADHFRSSAVFLTQAHPRQTEGSAVFAGTSMDQIFAQRFGQETPIPSMQLCIENVDQAGGCGYGYACVYTDTISWASPTEPLPMIRDPRAAFDQLFGAGGTAEERARRRQAHASILDWVTEEVARLKASLPSEDQARVDRYLENIRELERRLEAIETQNASGAERELPGAPAGVPDSYTEHMHLMFDLQALAFESDVTRVFSLKMSRDVSGRVFPETGVGNGYHSQSHATGEEGLLDFYKINKYHVSLLPYLLDRLASSMDGDASLLDKTMIVYGSPMGDGNLHNHRRVPFILLGGANGRLEGDSHLKAPDGTPLANVMLSLLHELGVDDIDSFGDSTGAFPLSIGTVTP